ncbi:unannotated protein [freshwater metagenome]|uniref:Unannotated protein n=1 Tax=freshwater metagenome TaxID=449393 RepID=A0A6J6DE96_9ZZZZ
MFSANSIPINPAPRIATVLFAVVCKASLTESASVTFLSQSARSIPGISSFLGLAPVAMTSLS